VSEEDREKSLLPPQFKRI